MVARPQAGSGVRIAELVATLSYAADLGLGQPMAHCMFFLIAACTARSSSAGLIWRNSLPVVAEGVWPGGA
jgi:hypothetical protein